MLKLKLRNKSLKFLFGIILAFLHSSVFSFDKKQDLEIMSKNLEQEIAVFEQQCLTDGVSNTKEKIISQKFTDCETEAIYLEEQILKYQSLLIEYEELSNVSTCEYKQEETEVEKILGTANKALPQVQCTAREIANSKKSCGRVWTCNALRSMAGMVDKVLPDFIEKPIKRYAIEKAESIDKGCLSEDKSDCMSELLTTIAGSLLDTGEALLDLAKAGLSSIFESSSWFSKTSESLHNATTQNVDNVKGFLDDPGEWLMDFMMTIKDSTIGWVKSSMFCQKWEGEPHLSECSRPLASFDCVDCETKINAVCIGAGVILGEAGIMALTLGFGHLGAIGARAGAATMKIAAKKAAAKIKIKSPDIDLKAKIPEVIKNKKLAVAAVKAVDIGIASAQFMSEKLTKIKEYTEKIKNSEALLNAKVIAQKTMDRVADPAGLLLGNTKNVIYEHASKVATVVGTKGMKEIGERNIKKVNIAKKRQDGKIAKQVESEVRPSKINSITKIYRASKDDSKPKIPKKDELTLRENDSNQMNRNNSSAYDSGRDRRNTIAEYEKESPLEKYKNHREGKKSQSKPEFDKEKKEKNADVASDNKKKKEEEESHAIKTTVKGVVIAAEVDKVLEGLEQGAVVDAEQKNHDIKIDESEVFSTSQMQSNFKKRREKRAEAEKREARKKELSQQAKNDIEKKFGADTISSDEGLKSALGISGNHDFTEDTATREKIDRLENIYSEDNRSTMVSKMMDTNRRLTRDDANFLFNKRQAQIQSAQHYLDKNFSQSSTHKNKSRLGTDKKKVPVSTKKVTKAELKQELQKLRDQVEELNENDTKNIATNRNKEDSKIEQVVKSPRSRRTVSQTRFPASNSTSNQGPINSLSFSNNNYEGESPRADKVLGTYHPEALEKQKNKDNVGPNELEDDEGINLDENEVSENREVNFNKLNNLFDDSAKSVSVLENINVDIDLVNINASRNVMKLRKFKLAIQKYGKARKVKKISVGAKRYEIYEFSATEVYGVYIDESGEKQLLTDREITSIHKKLVPVP